jgi:hypothetical protein
VPNTAIKANQPAGCVIARSSSRLGVSNANPWH